MRQEHEPLARTSERPSGFRLAVHDEEAVARWWRCAGATEATVELGTLRKNEDAGTTTVLAIANAIKNLCISLVSQ